MPLDIVGQVAHIDPAVLLGRVADGLHHVFFVGGVMGTILKRSARRVTTASTVGGTRRTGRARITQRRS